MRQCCAWCMKVHHGGPERCLHGVLLVCGGREFSDWDLLQAKLGQVYYRMEIDTVRHGKARGADALADRWAKSYGIKTDPCPADWHQWGKLAGHYRNQFMAEKTPLPVACVAFKGGNGTAGMVAICEATGIPVWKVGW